MAVNKATADEVKNFLTSPQFQVAMIQLLENTNPLLLQSQSSFKLPDRKDGDIRTLSQQSILIPALKKNSKPIPKLKHLQTEGTQAKKMSLCRIPYNRTRMLMKTAPNVTNVSQEAIAVATKAAELFVAKLSQDSHSISKATTPTEVQYKHVAQSVRQYPKQMKVLHEFLPYKVLAKDYLPDQKKLSIEETEQTPLHLEM